MNNHQISTAFPDALLCAGRREEDRSETGRSAADSKAGTARSPTPAPRWSQAKRGSFAADYKQRILADAGQAKKLGEAGTLLHRGGTPLHLTT
jgi:hypothetical protein